MLKRSKKVRFGLVGAINTALDFGILFILSALNFPAIPANYVSTSCALLFSFIANKKYTFQTETTNIKRQIILFLVCTLTGLWVLQPTTIFIVSNLFFSSNLDGFSLLACKLVATVVSLTWNYIVYNKYVFKASTR